MLLPWLRDSAFDIMLHLGQIGSMISLHASLCDAGAARRLSLTALLVLALLAVAWLAVT